LTECRYVNPRSGAEWSISQPLWSAPDDGNYLNLTQATIFDAQEIETSDPSIWRYSRMLRIEAPPLSLGEGWTPLIEGEWDGAKVAFKCDHMMPSGSFKDRGVSVMMAYLKGHGIQKILEDSSGNAGSSVATYAARANMDATIFSPSSAPPAKLSQMRAMGAELRAIDGPRQNAADAALSEALKGTFYAGHNIQPFFLEGCKTVAFELWEQLGGAPPDHVVVACGQGGNVIGLHIGFKELYAANLINKIPAIHGVQAINAAPYLASWESNGEPITIDPKPSIADGITSSKGVRVREVLSACRESGGRLIGVTELEIINAMRRLHGKGFFVEPTTAAGAAGLSNLISTGVIQKNDSIALLLTGTGLKAINSIQESTNQSPNPPST